MQSSPKPIRYAFYIIIFTTPLMVCKSCFDFYDIPKLALMGIGIFVALFASLWNPPHVPSQKTSAPVILFICSSLISTFLSVSPLHSILGIYRGKEGILVLLNFYLFYWLFPQYFSVKDIQKIPALIFFSSACVSLIAFFEYSGYSLNFLQHPPMALYRPTSTIGPSTQLAGYLATALPFVIFLLPKEKTKFILLLPILMLPFSGLLIANSRGSILAFALSYLLLFVLFLLKYSLRHRLTKAFMLFFAVCLIHLTIFPFKTILPQSTRYTPSERFKFFSTEEPSISGRISMWKSTLLIIKDYPALGCGTDSIVSLFPVYQKPELAKIEQRYTTAAKIHNQILQIAATQGVIGLFFWLWLVLVFYIKAVKLFLQKNDAGKDNPTLLLCCIGSFTAFLLQSLFTLNTFSSNLLFWLNLCMLDVLSRQQPDARFKQNQKSLKMKHALCMVLPLCLVFCFMADVSFKKSTQHYSLAHFTSAESYAKRATVLSPFEGMYKIFLASIYYSEGMLPDAASEYKKALLYYPNEPKLLTLLGLMHEGLHENKKAAPLYTKAYTLCKNIGCRFVPNDFFGILEWKAKTLK